MGWYMGRMEGGRFLPLHGLCISINDRTLGRNKNSVEVDFSIETVITGSARGFYCKVTNNSVSAVTGELTAAEFKVRSTTSNTASVKGIHISIDAKTKTITLARGIEVSLDGSAGGAITTAQGLRVAHNSSAAHTTITGLLVEGPGTWTTGLELAGAFVDGIKFSGTFSNTAIKTAISVAGGFNIGWLDVASTGISGDLTGLRPRLTLNAASAGQSARAIYAEVILGAGKYANIAQGVLAHVSVAAGNCKPTHIHVLGSHLSMGTSLTATDVYMIHSTLQSKGNESISGSYSMVGLKNEAHAGTGKKLDSFIKCYYAAFGGGVHAADYLIDGGIAADLIDTAFVRLPDDGAICHDTDTGPGTDLQFSDFKGFITVVIGDATRYVLLCDKKPSALT